MNRKLRVLMVGRHFWPHGRFDAAGSLFSLAAGLQRAGVHVEVMTPRYASSWTQEFPVREIRVHRPTTAPRSDWSVGRYVRHTTTWLKENCAGFDLIYCDGMCEESSAVVAAARELGIPSVLKHGGGSDGDQQDFEWWKTGRSAQRCLKIAKTADCVVVADAVAQRALLTAGFGPQQITRIDPGFESGSPWSQRSQAEARSALVTANTDLVVPTDSPVVVCFAPMRKSSGIMRLVESARFMVARFPDLRLWLIGDGPDRDDIYTELKAEGVRNAVAMPGSFVNLDDLMRAADVFVQLGADGVDYFLPAAVSAECPVVAANVPLVRARLADPAGADPESVAGGSEEQLLAEARRRAVCAGDECQRVTYFDPDSAKALRRAARHAIETLPARRADASELRRTLSRLNPYSRCIEQTISLFRSQTQNRVVIQREHDRPSGESGK